MESIIQTLAFFDVDWDEEMFLMDLLSFLIGILDYSFSILSFQLPLRWLQKWLQLVLVEFGGSTIRRNLFKLWRRHLLSRTFVFKFTVGHCIAQCTAEAEGLSLQKGNRNLQLFIFKHNFGC